MKKYFFLLVDDDTDDSELFEEALREVDDSAIFYHAQNGEDALKKLNEHDLPAIIFLDINMPRMNGWECLRQLRYNERYRKIPVIMYSTSSHQEEIDIAASLGAANFYTKPNSYSGLKKMLTNVITTLKENASEPMSLALSDS